VFLKLQSAIWLDRPVGTLSKRILAQAVVPPGALRLILAMIVVVAHYAGFTGNHLHAPIDGVAVSGFFFLSGFWVTRLWDNSYSKLPSPISTFYISRAWRIYPLATIGTLAMVLVADTHVGPGTLLSNLGLIGLGLESGALNPPEWSLAVEVQFYLVAPLLFVLLWSTKWTWPLLGLGGVCWLPHAFGLIDTSLPVFLVPFLLGALYARHPLPETAARFALAGLALFFVFGVLSNATPFTLRLGTTFQRFVILALSASILPYVALSVLRPSSKTDRVLGDLAFPVYIAHWPVYVLLSGVLTHWVLAAMAATMAVSILLWAFVDRPLEKRRRDFVASQRAKPAQVSTDHDGGLTWLSATATEE
jgi:peptidoglycan/LPS O-acetylase OafA/YrhL